MKICVSALAVLCASAGVASAGSTLLIAHDTAGKITEHTTAGAYITHWGVAATNAVGPASDEFGNVWATNPAFGNNFIEKLSDPNTQINSVTATVDGNWIEDLGYLGGGQLLAGTYEGNVFKVDAGTGAHSLLFGTGHSFVGVTFDGTHIWTTDGFYGSGNAYMRDMSGAILASFATGSGPGGIGYDPADGTLYIGYIDGMVRHFTTGGSFLGEFHSGFGGAVDGLEVRVPAPGVMSTFALALVAARRRR